MAWIESHQTLRWHPKVDALCTLTSWTRWEAIGRLHGLWWWALDHRQDGCLGSCPGPVLEEVLGADALKPLIEAGWLDRDEDGMVHIHDWDDYAGRLVQQRETRRQANKERARRHRERRNAESNPVTNGVTNGACHAPVTGPTVPDRTGPDQKGPPDGGHANASASAPPAAGGKRLPPGLADQVLEAWNALAPHVRTARAMTRKRFTALRARWQTAAFRDEWNQALQAIPAQLPHDRAEARKGWVPDLDWFLRPDTVTQLLEGRWDGWGRDGPGATQENDVWDQLTGGGGHDAA